jgi:Na+-driven multidrug efflux pump
MLIEYPWELSLASTYWCAYYGAKNFDMERRVVNNSFSVAIIWGLLSAVAKLSSDRMLGSGTRPERISSCHLIPEDIGRGFIFMYMGLPPRLHTERHRDTVTPLIFMVIGSA